MNLRFLCFLLFNIAASAASPNILLILADDMGWGDVSCNNPQSAIRTPALDALAADGAFVEKTLDRAHDPAPVARPDRATRTPGADAMELQAVRLTRIEP